MANEAKVIGFDNLAPSKVLTLLAACVKKHHIQRITPIFSSKIEEALLQAPYCTFVNNSSESGVRKDLLIYALPRSLAEYKAYYSQVNEIRNILLENAKHKIVVLYAAEINSFIGWNSIETILSSFERVEQSTLDSLRSSESIKVFAEWDIKYANLLSNHELNKNVVLVIGSGGREHAMAVALSKSIHVSQVMVCPGNGGSNGGKIQNAPTLKTIESIVAYCCAMDHNVHLVAVGPEQPLVDGLVNELHEKCPHVLVFGPTKEAAILEASKAFTKDFLEECKLPTASYQNFTSIEAAKEYAKSLSHRVVIKASGLAAGKGVLLPTSADETLEAIDTIMQDKTFGAAGDTCVIEQYLDGEEASCIAFCDGKTAKLLPAAQDHKRALDNDEGLNTGGMGAYAPAPILTPFLQNQIEKMCQVVVKKMADKGMPYVGILYAGIMLTADQTPYILEFNCRFGDPETQVLLPLLESDLFEIMCACCQGTLEKIDLVIKENTCAATVVCAAKGYPEKYDKGMLIAGLDSSIRDHNVFVYHAGTKASDEDKIICNGGRVLSVTGIGSSLTNALQNSYSVIRKLDFKKENDTKSYMHYRSDIGTRALLPKRKLRIGVLGSTRGTSLIPIIEACNKNSLHAEIVCILSNKSSAPILEKYTLISNKCHAQYLPCKKGTLRYEYDAQCTSVLKSHGVEFILCIGYMRILSEQFCSYWHGKCLNVHPSLLPKHAGLMDLAVHQAVLDANELETGCTVHYVTEEVDGGPIAIQKTTKVEEGETTESLKQKVQQLEGQAFIEAIQTYINNKIKLTYAAAGVDIQAGNEFVDNIKALVAQTKRPGCDAALGGFGGVFDLSAANFTSSDTILIGATDGVGTKLKIAQITNKHDTIGIDLVAMSINDLLVTGAEPLFFLDYFSTSKLDMQVSTQVVKGIAQGCIDAHCGLIGGETAEMPGIYQPNEYDLAGFAVGAVLRDEILPKDVQVGNVVLGLKSSGVHSNGYSLVRRLMESEDYNGPCPWDATKTMGDVFITPTRIYVKQLLPLIKKKLINGLAHITGGGLLENLPRSLPIGVGAKIRYHPALPPVFKWIKQKSNLDDAEMLRTFNCGIGMIIIVKKENVETVKNILKESDNEEVFELGELFQLPDADNDKERVEVINKLI